MFSIQSLFARHVGDSPGLTFRATVAALRDVRVVPVHVTPMELRTYFREATNVGGDVTVAQADASASHPAMSPGVHGVLAFCQFVALAVALCTHISESDGDDVVPAQQPPPHRIAQCLNAWFPPHDQDSGHDTTALVFSPSSMTSHGV